MNRKKKETSGVRKENGRNAKARTTHIRRKSKGVGELVTPTLAPESQG